MWCSHTPQRQNNCGLGVGDGFLGQKALRSPSIARILSECQGLKSYLPAWKPDRHTAIDPVRRMYQINHAAACGFSLEDLLCHYRHADAAASKYNSLQSSDYNSCSLGTRSLVMIVILVYVETSRLLSVISFTL